MIFFLSFILLVLLFSWLFVCVCVLACCILYNFKCFLSLTYQPNLSIINVNRIRRFYNLMKPANVYCEWKFFFSDALTSRNKIFAMLSHKIYHKHIPTVLKITQHNLILTPEIVKKEEGTRKANDD